jgi:hypothetical protein
MNTIRAGLLLVLAMTGGCALDIDDLPPEDIGVSAQELSRSALSRSESRTVLQLIDNICGDTWCEGDHNFSFDQIECQRGCPAQPGSCKLTFRLYSYDTTLEVGPTFTRACRTPGFTGFASLVQTTGEYQSLQPSYYDALSECIARVESTLPAN